MKHLALIIILILVNNAKAGDWRQFRGPGGTGIANDAVLPATLDQKNLKWSTEMPGRGLSGVIVVGERVILTCSSGPRQDRLHVV